MWSRRLILPGVLPGMISLAVFVLAVHACWYLRNLGFCWMLRCHPVCVCMSAPILHLIRGMSRLPALEPDAFSIFFRTFKRFPAPPRSDLGLLWIVSGQTLRYGCRTLNIAALLSVCYTRIFSIEFFLDMNGLFLSRPLSQIPFCYRR